MNHPELVYGLEFLPCAIRDGMLYIPHADGNWVSAAKLQSFSLEIIKHWRAESALAASPADTRVFSYVDEFATPQKDETRASASVAGLTPDEALQEIVDLSKGMGLYEFPNKPVAGLTPQAVAGLPPLPEYFDDWTDRTRQEVLAFRAEGIRIALAARGEGAPVAREAASGADLEVYASIANNYLRDQLAARSASRPATAVPATTFDSVRAALLVMLHEARNFNDRVMREAGVGPFDLVAIRQAESALTTPPAAPGAEGERELIAAAQAVIERWDSPAWKDAPHTAIFINRMREAIAAAPTLKGESNG